MNRQRLRLSELATCALALLVAPTSVLAALASSPTNTNLTVQANVPARCLFTATTTVDFGAYDPTAASPTDQNGAVTIQCTKGTSATIDLGIGSNFDGTTRRMASSTGPTEYLTYSLFTDSPGGTKWGTGIAGGTTKSYAAPNTSPTSITVYGRLDPSQDVKVDSYQDTVVVTATF